MVGVVLSQVGNLSSKNNGCRAIQQGELRYYLRNKTSVDLFINFALSISLSSVL